MRSKSLSNPYGKDVNHLISTGCKSIIAITSNDIYAYNQTQCVQARNTPNVSIYLIKHFRSIMKEQDTLNQKRPFIQERTMEFLQPLLLAIL